MDWFTWIIKYWAEVLFTTITGYITYKYKKTMKEKEQEYKDRMRLERVREEERTKAEALHKEELLSMKYGMIALLRSEIVQAYTKFNADKFCPIYERENIDDLYKQYKNLGGNGVVTNLMIRLDQLPTE